MSFIFMVFHYPEPSHRDQLIRSMREMAAQMEGRAGLLEVGQWAEPGSDCVIGISKWTSREAFFATGITLRPPDEIVPGETRARVRFLLEEAAPNGG